MNHVIRCRARIGVDCLDGQSTRRQFGSDLPMTEDGTYTSERGVESIVCDSCYLRLMPYTSSGMGLNHELADAIASYRALNG